MASEPTEADDNPCLSCGACCTRFRVSFHWMETTLADGMVERSPGDPAVPAELTEPLGPHRQAMRGTTSVPARCVALSGEVGRAACCSIHPVRPSPCREFPRSWEYGEPHDRCDASRAAFGLPPLPRPARFGGTAEAGSGSSAAESSSHRGEGGYP